MKSVLSLGEEKKRQTEAEANEEVETDEEAEANEEVETGEEVDSIASPDREELKCILMSNISISFRFGTRSSIHLAPNLERVNVRGLSSYRQ